MGRPGVSLTMIVRDEEANLPASLGPLAGLFDEIIVVDTGSSDRTREVAASLGAKVFDFPWCDNFAAARNEALRLASGRWAFKWDADDRIDAENLGRLRALLAGLPEANVAYTARYLHAAPAGDRPAAVSEEVRLFRNDPPVRWRYRVHEQIAQPVLDSGGVIRPGGVEVRHEGFRDPAQRRRKLERNLRLLRLDLAERPGDPFVLFYLGWTELDLGRPAEAVRRLRESVRLSQSDLSVLPRTYALLVRALRQAGRAAEALPACREGRARFPRDAELLYREGELLLHAGAAGAAEGCFRALLAGAAEPDGLTAEEGLCGYKARHLLAAALGPGRPAGQEPLWREALRERPDFLPAWLGLGELYAAHGRWNELEGALGELERLRPGGPEAASLRARWRAARGDFAGARRLLEGAVARHPREVLPRLVLAQILLLEGWDVGAAAEALRGVLGIDPDNATARRLLHRLRAP